MLPSRLFKYLLSQELVHIQVCMSAYRATKLISNNCTSVAVCNWCNPRAVLVTLRETMGFMVFLACYSRMLVLVPLSRHLEGDEEIVIVSDSPPLSAEVSIGSLVDSVESLDAAKLSRPPPFKKK